MLLHDGTVKILDFGIAKVEDLSLTGHGAPVGTIAYMSPEHVRGSAVDHRGDIWALGVLVHEMLTGSRPFAGEDRQTVCNAILTHDPDLVATAHPDVPAGIENVLRRALAKRPDDRYPSMASFAVDLAALASTPPHGPGDAVGRRFESGMVVHDPAPLPASERRRAAVLVTIVSNYGALVEHVAAVDAHRLVAQVRDLAVEVVRRHGGLVNQAIGEEIVSLFGVPTAHEDDELRALRAAWELHARVRELTVGTDSSRMVRIQSGLHVGPVVAQRLNEGPRRYAIVGAPGPVAARLATLAGPDGVVVSPECQRLVAPFVHVAPCSPVVLEPEAQPCYAVSGYRRDRPRDATRSLGAIWTHALRRTRVGARAARDRGRSRACRRRPRRSVVVGEAGVGKSRLLHEVRERVAAVTGIRLLHGRCRAYGDVAPYFPFIEIVRDALEMRTAAIDSRDVIARLRAIDVSLEPFLPLYLHLLSVSSESHPLPRHLQGEHLQAALLDALTAFVTVLASRATLVVLLEDWHWADSASRGALARMAEIVSAHTLLFVVTTRPERGTSDHWPAHGSRIQLEPLDFAASTAIMQAVLRVERVSDDLARRVFERTGGNPFFLEQVCCALLEQGAVAAEDGEALVEGGPQALSLPDTVQAVIRTRLDNLEPSAREVLRVASVIGREFEHALLADVLGSHVDLVAAIDPPQDIGADPANGRGPGNRVSLQTRADAGGQLREPPRPPAQGAARRGRTRHREASRRSPRREGRPSGPPLSIAQRIGSRRCGTARRAADRASALSQFADAMALLDQVLEWLPHLPDDEEWRNLRADVLLQQERTCETLGLRRRQQEIVGDLIAHLAPTGPSARLAQTYLREGDLLTLLKRFSAADRALSTALRISRELDDASIERHTLRSIGLLRWHEGRHEEALTITEDALAIARECHDELAVAGDLTNLGSILKSMGNYADRAFEARGGVARARSGAEEAGLCAPQPR